ncbi:MAG: hypothetical protein V4858_13225 [Pseudomonadota bacterium]
MSDAAGRTCPLHYRYGAERIAAAPEVAVETLYVVGGLYGNTQALDTIEAMAAQEPGPVTLCFNGDFNWFNVDDAGFAAINQRVLAHTAIQGNVEAELLADTADAGCGCAYPDSVGADTVARSNHIHARLKATAQRFPALQAQLAALPMFARFNVGGCRVGVVHGDADSLAGWRFDEANLGSLGDDAWLAEAFARANVDVFASTHTCLPALRQVATQDGLGVVINNGAAGMPNFAGVTQGLVTRISLRPSITPTAFGVQCRGIHVDALSVAYDHGAWSQNFLRNWPAQSDAHVSYYNRIQGQLQYTPAQALK